MFTTSALARVRRWTLAVVGVWLLSTSVASAQTSLRGPPGVTRTIIVSASVKNPLPPHNQINIIAVGQPNVATGTVGLGVPATFLGFADHQAVLPPANPENGGGAALNNGSLQMNTGNIASLPLGDRLKMNGTTSDPDLIDSLNGGQQGQQGQQGQPGQTGQPGVLGYRAARYRAMAMASAYQAQRNWYLLNLYRASALLNNSYAANASFGSMFNTGSYFPAGSFGLTNPLSGVGLNTDPNAPVAFAGFARDTNDAPAARPAAMTDKSEFPAGFRVVEKSDADKP